MIKLTLGQIADMVVSKAVQNFSLISFPIKVSYRNTKIIKRLNDEFVGFDAMRIDLCRKHGQFDGANNQYTFSEDGARRFQDDFNELRDVEVELDFDPIDVSNLPEKCEVKPSDLIYLLPLFLDGPR